MFEQDKLTSLRFTSFGSASSESEDLVSGGKMSSHLIVVGAD
jgi:hypothetical protein